VRLHGEVELGHALGDYQQREFGFGVSGRGAAEYGLNRVVGAQLELGSVWLSQGKAPLDPSIAPGGSATSSAAALGLRVRPFGNDYHGSANAAGLWLAADFGVATTNSLTRGVFDADLGYDFMDNRGRTGMGPVVSLLHVFQPNSALRPEDANILLVGLHAFFDFGPGLNPNGDRDHDGILDDVDACPDVPEDKDGFEDSDGCPDDDNDKDGIPDKLDKCPNVPEDKDGFEDGDGCPDDDNDKDGIADKLDKCPDEPEDKDGFEDTDGCPEPDNDKDGIPDTKDLCPNEPETFNGYADSDGCPDEDQVRVVGDKIVLDDRVHFFVNSFVIRKVSYPLLSRLSKLVAEHPEYTHISVEGHADERGTDSFNQKLSEDRARAVLEFLVKQGIPRERLSSVGYGSTRPLVDKKNEYALLLNRRVEFTVTRQLNEDGSPVVSAPVANPSQLIPATPVNPEDTDGPDPNDPEPPPAEGETGKAGKGAAPKPKPGAKPAKGADK